MTLSIQIQITVQIHLKGGFIEYLFILVEKMHLVKI